MQNTLYPKLFLSDRVNSYVHSLRTLLVLKLIRGIALCIVFASLSGSVLAQAAASSNYATQTGTLGTTYSWADCSGGTSLVFTPDGDDGLASFSWPFEFSFYDNTYTTSNSISVATNGFIRLDGTVNADYIAAQNYTLSSASTELGQIIATSVQDCNLTGTSWVKYLVTGTAPNRILTIEFSNIHIPYDSGNGANVQVSFYETLNIVVLKLGTDNITQSGVDMGIHSGVSGYFNKWQEVAGGTNNTWIEYTRTSTPTPPLGPKASWNYGTQTGTLNTTYSWINCSSGSNIVTGDEAQALINWPFDFNFYDNTYTTAYSLSLTTNGFIRLDGDAGSDYSAASAYNLTSSATNLGQIIALGVFDGKVGDNGGWVRSLVTGTAPYRIFTIEYNNLEIDYRAGKYADIQVSFYESSNKIVLKFGTSNVTQAGADMGLHSGVSGYFNKWQEVASGTNNTWIEYTPTYIELNATSGTSIAYYSALKDAFNRINDGTHRGNITIKINKSTTEVASAVLNASGAGSANYSSVNIYPTETGLSIRGDLAAPLIDLNGADNVTIDGRVNATGNTKDLSIINSSAASVAATSTIRFINDATNNTVKYCTIKGSETVSTTLNPSSGIIYFAAGTNVGNDGNTIDNNNITSTNDASRPVFTIYSFGTSGKENSGITISNNKIYDVLKDNTASNCIFLSSNTTACNITGNSFYETTVFSSTLAVTYNVIFINNISGNGFIVSDNYIGGSAALCGGSAWTKSSANNNVFNAISLSVGTTAASSVQNNTIQNINWSNSGSAAWRAISILAGDVNVGTITGNAIGAATGIESIVVTNGANGNYLHGIRVASTGTVNVQNNIIGSIKTATVDPQHALHLLGIEKTNVAGAVNITDNIVGGLETSNSLLAASAASGNYQYSFGIRSLGTGITTILNNTVSNITNNVTSTSYSSRTGGIVTQYGNNTITSNTVNNISSASAQPGYGATAAVTGISQLSAVVGTTQIVDANTVRNINSTQSSARVDVYGILYNCPTVFGNSTVNGNFIHSLSASSSNIGSSIDGIVIYSGSPTCANNIISLGSSLTTGYAIYGIWDNGGSGNSNQVYFNTVYIGGSVSSGTTTATAALWGAANNSTRDYRNNVLFNARSGGTTGKHYAVRLAGNTALTIDYNDYYVTGTGGVLGSYANADKSTLVLWKASTGQDANSLNIDPQFATSGGTAAMDYITSASLPGVTIAGITTDFDGVTRGAQPKMGALETSVNFIWQGNTSTDLATASNWVNGAVPPNGADISFAASPTNDCYLDQNRTLNSITNTSSKKFVVNSNQLTLTGNIVSATANQIDASAASSMVIFAGTLAQNIPNGVFVSNTIDALTLNNDYGLTQNGDLIIPTTFTLTSGAYSIGSNTLTINGTISTTSGSLAGGSSSNIVIGESEANTPNTTLPGVTLNNLTLNRSNGLTLGGIVSIGGTLTLTSGTLTLGPDTLTIAGNSPIRTSGNMDAGNASSTLKFSNPSAITLPASLFTGVVNNLTINGAGITASGDLTINGVLNLQSANPLATKGSLDMSTYALYMGSSSSTIGVGDVTGIVKRQHTFAQNVEYSFGSHYTTFTFTDANLKPTWISVEISIGAVASWTPWEPSPVGKVKRLYKIASSENASTSAATINMRYLLSELDATDNDESQLVFWHKKPNYAGGLPHEHGRSNQDFTNHFIGVAGLILGAATTSNLDSSQVTMAYPVSTKNTWKGEVAGHETEWELAGNWTANHVPLSTDDVLIPGGLTHYPSLTASSNAVAKTIEIHSGASITANSYTITVSGAGGAWLNNGTFNAGAGKVLFNHGVPAEIVTVAGITDFYDIEVAANTTMQPVHGNILRIAGVGSADITSIVDFSSEENTVEWNGAGQTIVNPSGIGGNSGYYKLILSGSGTKTMPTTAMNIADELKLTGTVTATAQAPLTIGVEFEILEGATFATGNFDHTVGGPFDNRGTFIASPGTKITLNGTVVQNIYGGSPTTFEKLTINNAAGIDIFTDITVNDELALTNGNLNVGTTLLTINSDVTKTTGFLNVNTLSSLTFGGTSAITLAANVFATTPEINNLTINRTGGVSFGSDLTVNGILNLQSANPTDFIGSLDMGSNTLSMGDTATTTGIGDVTGRIKRTTILPNIEYTFGNKNSSVTFPNIGTLPTQISMKVSIGTVPTWKADGIKRIYDISQIGGSGTKALIKAHYLDSELNGNNEINLSFFGYIIPTSTLLDRGLTELNTTDNWITLNNADFGNLPSAFGVIEHGFGVSTSGVITWDGTESTDWFDPSNWTPAFAPALTKVAIIPDAATTPNDPLIAASSTSIVKTLSIQAGGILNAGAGSQLTINGASGAWSNNGTFNASTGKVIFNKGVVDEIVTIAGVTNFYNIEVGANTTLQPVSGSILRIAGAGTADVTSVIDFSAIDNTVEWNGANQTIVVPNGISGNGGYFNLILSGSGTKTMPSGDMKVFGNFSTSGTINATAVSSFTVVGNITVGNGTDITTGAYSHYLGGNFQNNGTFNSTTGGNMVFNGSSAQTISGASTTSFDNLTIDNIGGVALACNINVNNALTFNNGTLSVGANTLGINGTISNPSGNIGVDATSNLIFGGTTALTLNNNLFSTAPSINNITINRTGGVTLGNQSMTVNGTLALTAGTFTLGANTLTLAGNSPTRTTGNINASNSSATLAFANTSVITLPASLITGNINNLTVNGAGVNAGSDLTLNGTLNLLSANQSATVGSLNMGTFTLNMGVAATTTGTGDVTGIVRREHAFTDGVEYSFGNQYTNLNFLGVAGSTKPTWVSCKISIGAAPTWRSEAINRYYSFAQSGGTDRMIVKLHYLDSELHDAETDETQLVFWDGYNPDLVTPDNFTNFYPRNHSGTNTTENWIQLTGPAINYLATSAILDVKQWGLSYSNVSVHTWIGLGSVSYPGDWSLPGHWEGGVPQEGDSVLIPATLPAGNSGYPYRNLLPVLSPAMAKTIEIEAGAILNSDGYNITVNGSGDAWINNGTFTAGSGTVIFNHGDEAEVVNLNGTTNFNNLTVSSKTFLQAASGSTTRIAGTCNAESGSKLDFTSNANTVEYNGSVAQNVANQPTESASGYYNLVLSGSGTKTLSSDELKIYGNLTTNATVSAAGNSLLIIGSATQNITGTVLPTLNNLTISNTTNPVTASVNLTCSGNFTNSGQFDMTSAALAVAGTVTNTGTVKTASVAISPLPSGKTWGGTVEYYKTTGGQTVVGGTFNNLTLSNTSGAQSASGDLTVNSTLTTTSGGLLNMATYQLLGTLSTISNSGTIQTQNTSATPIPTGRTWGGTVQYNSAIGGQTAMAGTYNILTLSNTSGTQTASGDVTATTFNTAAGGTLNMGTNVLSVINISHAGILRTQNTSSTPFTAGLTWGGTVVFDGTVGQTLPAPSSIFNNLSIGNTAGVTAAANQTVNGILNLSVANPDDTHGSLDMSTYTLETGITGTTTGTGDVTGIVKRTGAFVGNVSYSYGNQYTTVTFINTGTKPSWLSCQIVLGAILPTKTGSVKRYYSFAVDAAGTYTDQVIAQLHYLDSELNGNTEASLVFWDKDAGGLGEHGKTGINTVNNWVDLAGLSISYFAPSTSHPSATLWGLSNSETTKNTWSGASDTEWRKVENWTGGIIPTTNNDVLIPASMPRYPSLTLTSNAVAKTLEIESGASITANSYTIDISGATGAWVNNGTFTPGTGTVTFSHSSLSDIVSISGTSESSFYNLTLGSTVYLQPTDGQVIKIAGALTQTAGSILDLTATENAIEYNGSASQLVIDPIGPGTDIGYEDLVISGTGAKTFESTLHITGELINNQSGLAITGTTIFRDNGDGYQMEITGTYAIDFENLTLESSPSSIITTVDITASGTLTVESGAVFKPGATNTVGGAGTLTGYGTVEVTRITTNPDFVTQFPIANKTLINLTVDYEGDGDQTVNALNYGNLIIEPSVSRTVTLASSGTIGVSDVFDPDQTLTDYIVTGSTMNSNGTGAQTVPAFNYYNVIVSGNRNGDTITLPNSGTIGIAGHSSVTATNANFVITNSTIDFNGSGAQSIDPFTFWNVIFSGGGTKTTSGNLTVVGSFTVETGVTLNMDAYVLSSPYSGSITNNGTIQTACLTATSTSPLPSGKSWGGAIEYTGSAAQTVVQGTYNNLVMSGAGGGTTDADITINGVLNLNHANPSSTLGLLNTGSNILNMGVSATTIGIGDVTGIVKREHTYSTGVDYSFGNQFTTINFLGIEGATKPTWVSCKIEIGTAPVWRDLSVRRTYSFLQSGGNDRTYVTLHYLDSELNASETDESKIVMYTDKDGLATGDNTVALGKKTNDITDNWVEVSGMAINQIATSSTVYAKQYGFGYTNVSRITWTGMGSVSYPGDWSLPGNWLGGVPTSTDDVLIPGTLPSGSTGYPFRNQLSNILPAIAKTIEIESGATINVTGYDITISGDTNAWINNGAFNPGTSTVVFNNGSTLNTAEIAGTTNFYNLTVSDNTKIQAATGNILRVAGTFTNGSGSISDFITNTNTVEYNGSATQTVVNPGAGYGYDNLIFSSTGTKTLPGSTLDIFGNLTVNAALSASGNTISMEGSSAQSIDGSVPALLNNLTVNNATGVTLDVAALTSIKGTLLINSGKKFEIAAGRQLTVTGSLTNNAGTSGFVLHSDATGTASLLHSTADVPATIQRYISGATEAWHFLSSPVAAQAISGSWLPAGTYGNGTGYDLYAWNEPTNCWIYKLNTTSTVNWNTIHPGNDFVVGRGYLYSFQQANPTKEFTGILNNGAYNFGLTASGTDQILKGFNLAGNPYPSSIDWTASSGWSRSDLIVSGSGYDMWIWNPAVDNYGVCNSATGIGTNDVTQYIAPMQGFFVKASTTGNLGMDNGIRTHAGAGSWFKETATDPVKVSLKVKSETDNTADEALLLFGYRAGEQGAAKLFSHVLTAPSLYLHAGSNDFAVRYLTDTVDFPTVPVMFKPGQDGTYTISCNFNTNDFDFVTLEDRHMQYSQDMKVENNYHFIASKKDDASRFVLHFAPEKKNYGNKLPAQIFANGQHLIVDLTLVHNETTILIYDALGRVLLKEELPGLTQHSLSLKSPPQILIVQLRNQQGSLSRKLFYQNNY